MSRFRQCLGTALLIGWLDGTAAWAASPQQLAAERQRFLALLAQREATGLPEFIPLPTASVDAFVARVRRQGRTPPPVPPRLSRGELPRALADRVAFRQAFTVEYYRQLALRRPDGIAGGIFFGRGGATVFTPVSPLNIFTYFPVLRIPGAPGLGP